MSPDKFGNEHSYTNRREINGSRPSPLKIHKESHLIKKTSHSSCSSSINSSSSSSSLSTHNTSATAVASSILLQQQQQQWNEPHRNPVIIYTHSPKVIHTQARDFKALVQKLTGFSQSGNQVDDKPSPSPSPPQPNLKKSDSESTISRIGIGFEDKTEFEGGDERNTSSLATSDGQGSVPTSERRAITPDLNQKNAFISDIPLFTPNSADFFLSPGQRMYRYSSYHACISPNMSNPISPSVSEFLK